NTMKAFELSEIGIKPGLTVVRNATQAKMLELIQLIRCTRIKKLRKGITLGKTLSVKKLREEGRK
ncbi:MAG TPA: hypothetical protein VFU89_07185, partial [Rhabdochlamydiaceae bacterium]|nr:hypothetical protein [Rhabdochlamydiaceae bacterium]